MHFRVDFVYEILNPNSMSIQFDFLSTPEERLRTSQRHDEQLSLPVSPLQEKILNEDPMLSDRELEIMHILLTGHSIYEIGLKIFLSMFGVKYRLSSIYSKFGCSNRIQLIKKASSTGLQFRNQSGVKFSFFIQLQMREHKND